ncbi:ABC transporter ATP-binding protein [Paeniroseomonas aquatica]|uniref:ABC transporter ATP-binding protein n=1 Tax=Paeniroseomonas aquatica TaxID=373043 RepID=UPI00360D48F1
MDTPLIEFEAVAKTKAGLAGIGFALARGETLALLGPAGAGKTMLLRLLAGQERPDRGRLLLAGRDLAPLSPPRRGIAVFEPGLPARSTVQEAVSQPLASYDVPGRDRPARVARALTLLGLDGFEGRPLAALAPLPRLRVALARALAPEQPVLLLDDPLAGLDPPARRALGFELRRLVRRLGLTVLLATRDGEEAMALADRVAVLEEGGIAQLDTPRRLYEEPATAFVASLAGENNRLPGTVEWREEEECGVRLACGPLVEARVADAGGRAAAASSPSGRRRSRSPPCRPRRWGGALPAALRDLIFLGDHVRLLLELGEGGMLVAKRPVGSRVPVPGGPASVAWDPYAAFAFRALR